MTTNDTLNLIQNDKKAEKIDAGRSLFGAPTRFMLSVFHLKDLPEISLPEIAFAGRSNVGKSSLINAITRQNGLAKTSNTPGRTQCLNFFNQSDVFYLVDMPGYGYAKAPKKMVQGWQKLIRAYLLGRPTLKRVYVLIDSRHGLKEKDLEVMNMLNECAVSYQIILTKADKISTPAQEKVWDEITHALQKHGAAHPIVLLTSSEKALGIDTLCGEIAELVDIV